MRLLSLLELKREGKRLKKKYQIEILSVTNQRVRLQSPYWKNNATLLEDIKRYLLQNVPEVKEIRLTPLIGTVTLYFSIPKEFPFETLQFLEQQLEKIYTQNGVNLDE
ncbi:MAG: hypothetical protein LKJ22_08195 [Liquorilactobacillus nagelii]|jgi:hypothetical protein|uniref:hypothetical protein n=1 Tax=Liquorilactobacillus nagelii TaxID=82688 RepID=UPI002430999C|nr:hypothetical protein [Liquorilactobacillus nagelii]MCI1634029.1 hypothetical protein [Liquorilactobacillus nagelii]MCI1921890.1 hypothetical protein [Liquorilactobacillus nagelii]MCI1976464.1 hypothetical protein [Liquorilactobacillus nagelii]